MEKEPEYTYTEQEVSDDTSLHMSTVFRRNARDKKKKKQKRAFNFVVKGLLVSVILTSSMLTNSLITKAESYDNDSGGIQTTMNQQVEKNATSFNKERDVYQEDSVKVTNLNMAIKVLDSSIKNGQLTAEFYENAMIALDKIAEKIDQTDEFTQMEQLRPVIIKADKVMKSKVPDNTELSILGKRGSALYSLERLQNTLGVPMDERASDTLLGEGVVITSDSPAIVNKSGAFAKSTEEKDDSATELGKATTKSSKGATLASVKEPIVATQVAAKKKTAKVYLDGKVKTYTKAPYVEGSTIMVPTDTFKTLGAKISTKGKVTTITQGKTVVKVTTGSRKLTKGKTSYTLPVKVVKEGSKVMIPADALKKVYGTSTHKIVISTKNKKVTITKVKKATEVAGIKVKYGKHDYAVKNQKEYDYVMKKVKAKTDKLSSYRLGKDAVQIKYLKEYLNGARWDGNPDDMDERDFWLWQYNDSLGDLVKAGVSKSEIEKLIKLGNIYNDLQGSSIDPLNGKPKSAYDTIYKKSTDCDADAQTYSAVMDAGGYSNAIFATKTHAFFVVKIGGDWYDVQGSMFFKMSSGIKKELINSKEYKMLVSPTSGTFK